MMGAIAMVDMRNDRKNTPSLCYRCVAVCGHDAVCCVLCAAGWQLRNAATLASRGWFDADRQSLIPLQR
jgi:hypothetical protein